MNNAKLARTQAISGLLFSLFALVHLSNTALAALGPDLYNGFQGSVRRLYQWPLLELALVATLLVHVVSGIPRMRGRRGSNAKLPLRLRLDRYAAYYLAIFVFGHMAATRLPALLADAPPFFGGVSFSLHFMPWWFYPYYALLGFGGVLYEIGDPFDNDFARAYETAAERFSSKSE